MVPADCTVDTRPTLRPAHSDKASMSPWVSPPTLTDASPKGLTEDLPDREAPKSRSERTKKIDQVIFLLSGEINAEALIIEVDYVQQSSGRAPPYRAQRDDLYRRL
jgi:hypothetical protein